MQRQDQAVSVRGPHYPVRLSRCRRSKGGSRPCDLAGGRPCSHGRRCEYRWRCVYERNETEFRCRTPSRYTNIDGCNCPSLVNNISSTAIRIGICSAGWLSSCDSSIWTSPHIFGISCLNLPLHIVKCKYITLWPIGGC